jgi:hypothetical protein
LPHLEEVEIDGIKGADHELDFLRVLEYTNIIAVVMTMK